MEPRKSKKLRRSLGAVLLSLGLVMGVTVGLQMVTTEGASAHTGDLKVVAVCNTETGNYDLTATLTTSSVPSRVTGSSKWRIGTASFQGTPRSDAGMDRGPVSSTGNTTVTLGSWTLPGSTTGFGPWVYAYTKWSNGNAKGSDGRLTTKLKGDCETSVKPNPPKQDITCSLIYRDFGRALQNGDHINVTVERQNGSQYQVNVYVDRNIAGGYDTLGFRYSDGTTRALTKEEVKKGRIWLDLASKVQESYYKVQFVQINESENWPNLKCGTPTKPDKPKPVVEPLRDDRKSCETGVETRDGTKTTDWVFDEKTWTWVKAEPVTVWNDWTFVRELTPAEKAELGCAKPDKPKPVVEPLRDDRKSCETGVETRDGTKTTDWVFDEKTWTWVKAEPVTVWNDWTFVRELTPAEKAELGCAVPPTPKPKKVKGAIKKLDKCGSNNFINFKKVKGLHYVVKGKVVREGVWRKFPFRAVKVRVVADGPDYVLKGKTRFVVKFPKTKSCKPPKGTPDTGMFQLA